MVIQNPKLLRVITELTGRVLLTTKVPALAIRPGLTGHRLHQLQNRAVFVLVLLPEVAAAAPEAVEVRQFREVQAQVQVVQEAQDLHLQALLHQDAEGSK